MVQRINRKDIERIRNNPKDYLFIRAPMEGDSKVWVRPYIDMSCGLYTSWQEGVKMVHWGRPIPNGSRDVLQIKHLEWIKPSHYSPLEVHWRITVA